jgi:hypothetical protein
MRALPVNLPDHVDEWAYTIHENRIAFIRLEYDQDAENPYPKGDSYCQFYSFNRRDINYLDPSSDEAHALMHGNPDAVRLSYYEHGLSLWFVDGVHQGVIPDREWDCVETAGLWVPGEDFSFPKGHKRNPKRRAYLLAQAEKSCETYNRWVNGEYVGYIVEIYPLALDDDGSPYTSHDDYGHKDLLFDDSCWGFDDDDYAKEQAAEAAERYLAGEDLR